MEKYSIAESSAFWQSICDDEVLGGYYIQQFYQKNGARNVCFTDELFLPTDVNVIFRGSGNAAEWQDNGEGGYLSDTEAQKAAANYIEQLPEHFGNQLTASGHSKGGNKAQYVTITTNRIERCVSFDGQGFSKQFIEKYAEAIDSRQNRISTISAANDYVNILFYPIAASVMYIETEKYSNFTDYHYPEILLKNNILGASTVQNSNLKVIGEYTQWLQESSLISEQNKMRIYLNLTNAIAKGGKNLSMLAWLDTIISLSDLSLGYFDNFIRDKMLKANPLNSYLSAVLAQLLEYRPISYQILRELYNALPINHISSMETINAGAANFHVKNNGYDSLIRLDTVEMKNVALRLQNLSNRMAQLRYNEQSLSHKMSIDEACDQSFNGKIDNQASSVLKAIAEYLIETSNNFEKIERVIEGG
nr:MULTISPECIES: Mbeg1-like protein [unclassified Enterococcus]